MKYRGKDAVQRAIRRFDRTVDAYTLKGSMHPDDHDAIDYEYKRARQLLEAAIERAIVAAQMGNY